MSARSLSRFTAAAAVVAVVTGLALTGCGSSAGADAFSVDGRSTSDHDFQRELRALRDNAQLQKLIAQSGGSKPAKGAMDPKLTATWAQAGMQQSVVDHEFAQRHLKVSARAKKLLPTFRDQYFSSKQVFDAFPKWFRDLQLGRFERLLTVLGPAPTEAELRKSFEELKTSKCPSGKLVSHILVKTKAEADAIAADLAKGADFASTAAQKSTDTQSAQQGGQVGCLTAGQYVPEFEKAADALAPDTVSAPVQTQYGWHLIKVTPLTFEGQRAAVEQNFLAEQNQKLSTHLQNTLKKARVSLNPKYGRVVRKPQFAVEPPAAPKAKTRPSTGRNSATTTTASQVPQGGATSPPTSAPASAPATGSP
ncbi:MAG: peptidylprolyl isomerase [Acidimicrobiia bacterium]